jgi:hypothetical protein
VAGAAWVVGGALEVEEDPDRGPHLSAARGGGRELVGWRGEVGRLLGCAGWAGLGLLVCFFFLSFFSFFFQFFSLISFQIFTQSLFKIFKLTFKPHNQSKAHAFNMMHNHLVNSKLINYYCIYLKASLIIQIH